MRIYSEIKKYLLYLVCFFCVIISGHIVILYLYNDATEYPLPGGTLNIWILWDKPTINILDFDAKIDNNTSDTLLRFVTRWLLRYSLVEKKIVNDLATCSIETFPIVRCTLNQHALWNDGTSMKTEDIIGTFSYFREKSTNPYTKSLLEGIDVREDTGDVVFQFKTKDITTLQVLFLPILRNRDLEKEWDGTLWENMSQSGPYVLSTKASETDSLYLTRNNYYNQTIQPFYYDQIRFGFGKTPKLLRKNIHPDLILGNTPLEDKKYNEHRFIRPTFYGAFLNTKNIPNILRKSLIWDVINDIDIADPTILPVENIFLGDIPNTPVTKTDNAFFQTVFALWYSFGGSFQTPENTTNTLQKIPLKYITHPENVSPIFSNASSFEIRGTAPAGTNKIIVNEFVLKKFNPKKLSFSYTAKPDFLNLSLGENTYRISFYAGSKLITEESLTLYYHPDSKALLTLKNDWETKNAKKTEPTKIVQDLDPKKLFNRQGKALSFKIVVQSEVPYLATIGEKISQKLIDFWSEVTLETLSKSDIQKNIVDPKFEYDIIISGVNLWLFHYNVAPFLHSNNQKTGSNLMWLRDNNLDALLSKLTEKLYYNTPDKLRMLQTNILQILEKESVLVTLGSPYEYIAAKPSILELKVPEFIIGRELLSEVLSRSYFKIWYKRSEEQKTLIWFFTWLKNALFTSS